MAFDKLLEEFKQKTDEVLAMGGAEKLAKRKAEGHLNARERIDYLIDDGSFIESGRFARSNQPAVKHKTPAATSRWCRTTSPCSVRRPL